MRKKIILAVVLIIVIGAIAYLEAIKPYEGPTITAQQTAIKAAASGTTSITSPAQFLTSRASIVHQESTQYQAAAEITDPTGWVNAKPFTLASLIGKKVVLVDFWTYSCINCLRTIPYLNAWYAKYKDAGLVIVGIHTPEFQFEHDINNVQAAVKKLGIQYAVVLDSNMGTWNVYQNLYWPNEYLINVDGFIVHNNIGEGNYNKTETAIQAALIQRDEALGIATSNIPTGFITPSDTISIDYAAIASPETYFGAARNQYLANGPALANGVYTLTTPSTTTELQPNALYLDGKWDFEDQYATNQNAGATVTYEYDAKNVYMVASAASPVTVEIFVDGKSTGTITVQANQLYNIVQGDSYGAHTLKLIVQNPGLKAYTFTFG